MSRGRFLTLEGGDGAGKTTQARVIEGWLRERGYDVVRTREPGGTEIGAALRNIVLHAPGPVSPRAETLIYAADRAQNIAALVTPALERGAIVLQDRYIDSSVAYQGSGRQLAGDEVRRINEWATSGLEPELTILLDVDPAIGLRRVAAQRSAFDRLERETQVFHERVRASYLEIAAAHPDRVFVVDANRSADAVSTDVLAVLAGAFEPRAVAEERP